MTVYVALLRGLNVGGHNKLKMDALRAIAERCGYGNVQTYIQSGNVVFSATAQESALVAAIEAAIEETFALRVPVVVRSRAQLAAVAATSPFDGAAPTAVHVAFLSGRPRAASVAALDPDRSPPDTFAVAGREVYLHYPNGSGRSKLTVDYLERVLGTRATARNWNTVTKLLTMTG